mmetsp:Transcript_60317/g.97635  ORF Transcript_60317/g.97635 Transcript_60317/m.97635 type:complete len:218 (+) Transcript_60317:230-883(+)
MAERTQQAVSNELDVLGHELAVHSDEVTRQCFANKFAFCVYSSANNVVHHILWQFVLQHAVNEAGKLSMQALIAGNQLVGEGKARHEAALLEPVDGAERAAEENTLDRCKGYDALGKAVVPVHVLHGPRCLFLNSRHGVDGIEDMVPLDRIFDVLLDQQRVSLRVNVLHGNLEAIEGSSFRDLHLAAECPCQVLQDNAIRSSKESQNVLDEVLLPLC